MSEKTENQHWSNSAVGIWAEDCQQGPFHAVKVAKTENGYEILRQKTLSAKETTFRDFLKDNCALKGQEEASEPKAVLGFDSSRAAFYKIELPPIDNVQISSVVTSQAEALLPLPIEQMYFAWRTIYDPSIRTNQNASRECTIVAAARQPLQNFVSGFKNMNLWKILTDGEAVVKVWHRLFNGTDQPHVIALINAYDTALFLAENGRLIHAQRIEAGSEDLAAGGEDAAGLFVADMAGAMEQFKVPQGVVTVISGDLNLCRTVVSRLNSSGITAQPAHADLSMVKSDRPLSHEDLCRYLIPLGLTMIALDNDNNQLELFRNVDDEAKRADITKSMTKLKNLAIAAVLALVFLLAVSYGLDRASVSRFENPEINAAIKAFELKKAVAEQRPDILALFTIINNSGVEGTTFDSVSFSKNGPVKITASASDWDRLYEFQKKLLENKNISNVNIQNPVLDERARRINFKMSFDYRYAAPRKQ